MRYLVYALLIYLALISAAAAIVTVYDKHVSKIEGHRRVPEKTLLILSALGGGIAMYATMQSVRHKTKHPKFMLGIPAIIAVQIGLCILVLYLRSKA